MADDDEFGDEIDWSTVQLPSISASMAVPRASEANSMEMAATARGVAGARPNQYHRPTAATPHHSSVYPPLNGAVLACDRDHSSMTMLGSTALKVASGNLSPTNSADVALRRQIEDLQKQLQTKDDQIFELEATAAASHAESNHRTQQAEANAQKRIHLVEEELRRTRMEAEKYRGSWIRQKKRVAELERPSGSGRSESKNGARLSGNNFTSNHGGTHDAHAGDSAGIMASNVSTWGPPDQVEVRKVTPGIGNEEYDNKNHNQSLSKMTTGGDDVDINPTKASGLKRKAINTTSDANVEVDATKRYLPRQLLAGGATMSISVVVAGDSARQNLAKHLLNRAEMGCYSLPVSDCANIILDTDMPIETDAEHDGAVEGKEDEGTSSCYFSSSKCRAAMQQDSVLEKETQTFVMSILFQMVESPESMGVGMPESENLTIPGLVHLLLVKFNSLFHCIGSECSTNASDGDGDHAIEQEKNPNSNRNEDQATMNVNKIEYQRMVLVLSNSVSQKSSTDCGGAYATVSWRAALYLLHILHDILLLSGNSRDDLRWWFYQSRQIGTGGAGGVSPSNRADSNADTGKGAKYICGGIRSHPRIEGLSPRNSDHWRDDYDRKEVLWTAGCHSSSIGHSDVWDSMTMAPSCNTFFELLVWLMKGNVFETSQNATTETTSNFGPEKKLVQLVQIKAIDLVLALMSDAPPYELTRGGHGNRTPYLWKFWCDSLLPSYSTARTVTDHPLSLNELSRGTFSVGDFLSPWEKSYIHSHDRLLGSGRTYSTGLLKEIPHVTTQQIKQSVGKQGRASNRSSRGSLIQESPKQSNRRSKGPILRGERKQHGRLSILIKNRTLQLLSHLVLCSSSISEIMYQKNVNEAVTTSLAKRILAAVLDEMDEYIVPFLASCSSSDFSDTQSAENCLQLCASCLQFLLILSTSNEGIRMLRVQMRLESKEHGPSRWSQSAIGCVTSVLDRTLSFVKAIEQQEGLVVPKSSSQLTHALNAIVNQCIVFFKTLLIFAQQQRNNSSSRKAATFLALISEHRTIFQSCCQRILAQHSPNSPADPPRLLHSCERLMEHVRYLSEEVVMDEDEENRDGK